jgi:hypothetical protein
MQTLERVETDSVRWLKKAGVEVPFGVANEREKHPLICFRVVAADWIEFHFAYIYWAFIYKRHVVRVLFFYDEIPIMSRRNLCAKKAYKEQ